MFFELSGEHCTGTCDVSEPRPRPIRYGEVMYLRLESCGPGWGWWGAYRPWEIADGHCDGKDWYAPQKGPILFVHQDGSEEDRIDISDNETEMNKWLISIHGSSDNRGKRIASMLWNFDLAPWLSRNIKRKVPFKMLRGITQIEMTEVGDQIRYGWEGSGVEW